MQAHHIVEVRRGLVGSELQVGGADLDELTTCAQTSQWQRRIGTTADYQVHVRLQVVEQKDHASVNVMSVDVVVIVEDQDDIVRAGAESVERGCQDSFDR